MSLWTAAEAVAATGGRLNGPDWRATGVSIDTRTLEPGDLFVALSAARDGHDFVSDALARGAAAALVSHVPDGVEADAPLLLVNDVQAGLESLGRAGRSRCKARVVAITGSVGKTSTKDMLAHVLRHQGATHAAHASYNNHWGVPLTLARLPRDAAYAVIEIGMNHPGEIAPLARMTRPHVAVVTTVGPAHLEFFGSVDGIAREKASIFEGLEPGGAAVLNGDLPTTPILLEAAERHASRVVTFGAGNNNHHRLLTAELHENTTVAQARLWRMHVVYKLGATGRHYAENALAVLAAVWLLGADRGLAVADLASWRPSSGRGTRELLQLDSGEEGWVIDLIDDAFNANPASMAAALEMLASTRPRDDIGRIARGRRMAILGDMLELGEDEMAMHAALAHLAPMRNIDEIHCAGPRMKALWDALPEAQRGEYAERAEEMAGRAHRLIDAGDVVLVKGSKGSRISLVVDALRKAGRAVAREDEDG